MTIFLRKRSCRWLFFWLSSSWKWIVVWRTTVNSVLNLETRHINILRTRILRVSYLYRWRRGRTRRRVDSRTRVLTSWFYRFVVCVWILRTTIRNCWSRTRIWRRIIKYSSFIIDFHKVFIIQITDIRLWSFLLRRKFCSSGLFRFRSRRWDYPGLDLLKFCWWGRRIRQSLCLLVLCFSRTVED